MHSVIRLLAITMVTFGLSAVAPGQFEDVNPFADAGGGRAPTKVEFHSEVSSLAPGEPFEVAVKLTHPPGWHSYYVNTGGVGRVFNPAWELPEGFEAARVAWPIPHIGETAGSNTYGYEGTVYHLFRITPPDGLETGSQVEITTAPTWQICDPTNCVLEPGFGPGKPYSLTLTVAESAQKNASSADTMSAARAMLPKPLPDGLSVEVVRTESDVTLALAPDTLVPEETIHFFDDDGSLDAQATPVTTRENGEVRWTIARQTEDAPRPGRLTGILTIGHAGYALDLPYPDATSTDSGPEAVTAEPSHTIAPADTPELLAEMAKLYDPESKINYRTLNSAGKTKTTFWTALVGAFIGGMILNLMPCVFPVLGIKVMGFVEQAGSDRAKVRLHGMAFTAGLVTSMWILAGALLSLKFSLGTDINWGAQMGNPYFVAGIILLLFILGLNLAGVFEMGLFLTSAGSGLQGKKGYQGSFFSGILTTLIATPCSGPFLGAAMGYTMAQAAPVALFLFTIFALGIASPYLFLSFFPKLIEKLPRPGAWMETFKKSLSFAMFATVAFFLQTFGAQTGVKGMSWLLMAMVVIGLALYFYGHYSLPHRPNRIRHLFGHALPLGIGALGLYMTLVATRMEGASGVSSHTGGLTWENWQPGKVEYRRSKKRIVWVDYTADW